MTLADKLASRDNGVTPLRLGFALLVVFGHAWEVSGHGPDPLQRATGVTCGEVGVNAFFALSGFLVTQSWRRSRSGGDFLWRRLLRILPGFWACLAVTGLGLFPWLWAREHGTTAIAAFHRAPFFGYVGRNALLRIRQANIGDLFAAQPAAGVVNGSLWSLFPEFLCYLGVALAGGLGLFSGRRLGWLGLGALVLFALHAGGPCALARLSAPVQASAWYLWRLSTQATFFAAGALGCLGAARLRVSPGRAIGGGLLLALATGVGAYAWLGPLLLPFSALQLAALLPGAWLDRIGDYSYGIYVYHFPLQQMLVFFALGTGSAPAFFALTVALVLPCAAASWHGVEKPALRLKGLLDGTTTAPRHA
jgi:peptidoglycan/LPS O-acetylase OafA/YrhL